MIELKNVTKKYGKFKAVDNISFSVKEGEIIGLLGPNGAGKSTTIKHIIGLLEQKKGSITINDLSLKKNTEEYRKQIGFIPETPSLYEELTLREHIEVTAMAYDIPIDIAMQRAEKLLHTFRLENRLEWLPANFSKGMKQKVMILCAFLIEPSLYIIDEPFLGLDPLAINALLELMVEMKNEGSGILMSTHILATAEKYCDRFVVLHNGEIRADGTLKDLQEEFRLPDSSLDEIYISLTKEQDHE